MAFRPFFEILNIAGSVVGRDLNGDPNAAVRDWVNNMVPRPGEFTGSKADLLQLISSKADACAASVKKTGFFTGNNTARSLCEGKISEAYSAQLLALQDESYQQEQAVTQQFLSNNNTIVIIGIVALVLILLIMI